ncbi:MAG: hypothetical protein MZV70_74545 [Desulfobacterales bacterium]|nr:hypothetical protein [Desulfobacterales bacterium]
MWPRSYRPTSCLGVNVFWKLVADAAAALKDYDIEVIEAHHNQKKDAPSGTALATVEAIKTALGEKEIVYGRQGRHAARKRDRSACRAGWRHRGRSHCALRRTRRAAGDKAPGSQQNRICQRRSAGGSSG